MKYRSNNMRNQRNSNRGDGRRGAQMVEFALTFLMFLMLVVGIFEGGRMVWTYTTLSHAARQGSRAAIVHGERNPWADDAPVTAAVRAQAIGLPASSVSVTTTWSDTDKKGGSVVTVTASYPLQFAASSLIFGSNGLSLSASSQATVAD